MAIRAASPTAPGEPRRTLLPGRDGCATARATTSRGPVWANRSALTRLLAHAANSRSTKPGAVGFYGLAAAMLTCAPVSLRLVSSRTYGLTLAARLMAR
jgi:hypothetical protein